MATSLDKQFATKMGDVRKLIDETYKDINTKAMASVATHLGRFSQILKGEKPMTVAVKNEKLEVHIALNVTMDTDDIASAMATSEGGSYFKINPNKEGSEDYMKSIEDLDPSNFGESIT